MRKHLQLGIFGFGCVGQGLHQVLEQSPAVTASIRKICVRDRNKPRPLPADRFSFDQAELLDDPEIDVIVELIDDAEAAWEIVSAALRRGKAVVTANKRLLAEHFEELLALQEAYGAPLLYEAAACASIPVVRNLEEYYDNDLLRGIEGIFNGSSNYILDRISAGDSYSEALREAQERGFAETDPSLDVGGFDSRYKLSILIAHAFGCWIEPSTILRRGIEGIGAAEQQVARERGWKLRLVAQARIGGGKGKQLSGLESPTLHASVLPQFVGPGHALHSVDAENNGVLLEGAFSQVQFFRGKGAGSLPTGSAVLSDISALSYNYRYEYRKRQSPSAGLQLGDEVIPVYVRYDDPAVLALLRFEEIAESYRGGSYAYVCGQVRQSELRRFLAREEARGCFVAGLPERLADGVGVERELAAIY